VNSHHDAVNDVGDEEKPWSVVIAGQGFGCAAWHA
jgi:hypothetical protein